MDHQTPEDSEHPLSRRAGEAFYQKVIVKYNPRLRTTSDGGLLAITRDVDLREGSRERERRWESPLRVLLARGDHFDLSAFVSGVSLGPLAEIPVYATDPFGRYVGKSHAPGLCQHSDWLGEDDERLTLGGWMPTLIELKAKTLWSEFYPLCSKCGGFAVWRLSDNELAYYEAACQLGPHEIPNELRYYESLESTMGREFFKPNWADTVKDLEKLHARLESLRDGHTELTPVVEPQLERCRVLMRRATMRRDSSKQSQG